MHKCHNQSAMHKTESLTKMLEQDILAGKFRPGEKLPSIRQLMEIYSLSKGTVERSIEALCKRGFLEKRAGSGSFVTDRGVFDETIEPGSVTVFCPRYGCFSEQIKTSMFVQILMGIREAANGRTELSSICSLGADPLKITSKQMEYANGNSAGIIFVGEYDAANPFLDLRVPAVGAFMCNNCDNRMSLLNLDAWDGAEKAVSYFRQRGAKHIVVVRNSQPIFAERAKIFAWLWQEQGGSYEFRDIADMKTLFPDEYFFFASDSMANETLQRSGSQINPLNICALDGKFQFNPEYLQFPTYAVDWQEFGKSMFEEMCRRIKNPGSPVRKIQVSGHFVIPEGQK